MERKDTAETGTDTTAPPSRPTPPDKPAQGTGACSSRSPSPEVRGCDLFVGNVPYTLSEAEVSELFRRYGRVSKECLLTDKKTGYRKGCAFVSYETYEEARHAHHELGRLDLDGRRLRVDWDRGLATKQQQWKEESVLKAQRRALFAKERSRSHHHRHHHSHRHHHHHHHKHKHSDPSAGSDSNRSSSESDGSLSGSPQRHKSHHHRHHRHRKSQSRSRSSHSDHHHHNKSSRSRSSNAHSYSSKTKEIGGSKKDETEKAMPPKLTTRSKSSSSSSSSSKSTSPYTQTLVIPDY